MVWNPLNGI